MIKHEYRRSNSDAENILENVMMRQRYGYEVRDTLAGVLEGIIRRELIAYGKAMAKAEKEAKERRKKARAEKKAQKAAEKAAAEAAELEERKAA